MKEVIKNKVIFNFKNVWCWVHLNKFYFFNSFIFFLLVMILLFFNIENFIFINFSNNLVIKIKNLCDTLIIFFSLIFAYLFGNYNYIKQKRIKTIKDYFEDLEKLSKKIIIFQKEIKNIILNKKEIIYKYKEICKFVDNLINKFQKEKIKLFSFDSWKLTTQFYKETNNFFKNFIYNYYEFKKAISKLENTNIFNSKDIDNFIKIFTNSNDEKYFYYFFKKINLKNNEILKIIFQINNFINLLTSDSTDILLTKVINFINKTDEKITELKNSYVEVVEVCYDHTHFWNFRKNKCFCWSTICKPEKIIFSKKKIKNS